ncbi:MAG: radical SAM protein [Cyanobacteria bacterium P01_H01_bin.15]
MARIVPSLEHILGDEFIGESTDWSPQLATKLATSKRFLFDHVSSVDIALSSGVSPDLCIFLDPSDEQLRYNLGRRGQGIDNLWDEEKRKNVMSELFHRSNRTEAHPIVAASVADAVAKTTQHLGRLNALVPPVHSFVVKVAARCNLDCDYCYMYQGHDQSWKSDPLWMEDSVIEALCSRINEYSEANPTLELSVVLHGGEPMAQSEGSLESLLNKFFRIGEQSNQVTLGVQTNGTHITPRKLQLLDDYGFTIGISCDNPLQNKQLDRRLNHSGASLRAKTLEGIQQAVDFSWKQGAFGGVLCVIDERLNGEAVYRRFRDIGVKGIDFLMTGKTAPETSWAGNLDEVNASPFLLSAFNAWIDDSEPCNVPFFSSIVRMLVGHQWSTDVIGLYPPSILEVSTRGDWQINHSLNLVLHSKPDTGLHVSNHSVEQVTNSDYWRTAHNRRYEFSEECIQCKNFEICGAGYITHRYKKENGFRNKSSRCDEIFTLIEQARNSLADLGIVMH